MDASSFGVVEMGMAYGAAHRVRRRPRRLPPKAAGKTRRPEAGSTLASSPAACRRR